MEVTDWFQTNLGFLTVEGDGGRDIEVDSCKV